MQKIIKILIGIVGVAILGALLLGCVFIFGGGYWENMPVLEHVSGPKRFKQFVVDPIPSEIYDLKKGYSGFPQGQVTTFFKFKGKVEDLSFLKDWKKVSPSRTEQYGIKVSKEYEKTMKPADRKEYLFFDEESQAGLFYIPGH